MEFMGLDLLSHSEGIRTKSPKRYKNIVIPGRTKLLVPQIPLWLVLNKYIVTFTTAYLICYNFFKLSKDVPPAKMMAV